MALERYDSHAANYHAIETAKFTQRDCKENLPEAINIFLKDEDNLLGNILIPRGQRSNLAIIFSTVREELKEKGFELAENTEAYKDINRWIR